VSTQHHSATRLPVWVRVVTPIFGHVSLGVINSVCDWFVLPVATYISYQFFGVWEGSLVSAFLLAPVFFGINWSLIRLIDYTGIDWLGMESLKTSVARFDKKSTKFFRAMRHTGSIGAFCSLSLYDPICATLYLRPARASYTYFTARDALLLFAATLYALLVGTILWAHGFQFVEYIRIIPYLLDVFTN
jgi:hypothetical protein